MPNLIYGLSEVAKSFDAAIIDLWGVLHDGVRAYPGAADCLAEMREAGITTCLLSNAPRRVTSVERKLTEVGIAPGTYDLLMTSGEATHLALRDRRDPAHVALGDRFYHLGPPRDDDVTLGLPLTEVSEPRDATFVLCTGIENYDDQLEKYTPLLESCLDAGLPLVCANPDLVVMIGDEMSVCAGSMAAFYSEQGGTVIYHGKPHAGVYDQCRAMMPEARRILAIGDSPRTDLIGAARAGLDSVWVLGGIHAHETMDGGVPQPGVIDDMLDAADLAPIAVMDGFRWA